MIFHRAFIVRRIRIELSQAISLKTSLEMLVNVHIRWSFLSRLSRRPSTGLARLFLLIRQRRRCETQVRRCPARSNGQGARNRSLFFVMRKGRRAGGINKRSSNNSRYRTESRCFRRFELRRIMKMRRRRRRSRVVRKMRRCTDSRRRRRRRRKTVGSRTKRKAIMNGPSATGTRAQRRRDDRSCDAGRRGVRERRRRRSPLNAVRKTRRLGRLKSSNRATIGHLLTMCSGNLNYFRDSFYSSARR